MVLDVRVVVRREPLALRPLPRVRAVVLRVAERAVVPERPPAAVADGFEGVVVGDRDGALDHQRRRERREVLGVVGRLPPVPHGVHRAVEGDEPPLGVDREVDVEPLPVGGVVGVPGGIDAAL